MKRLAIVGLGVVYALALSAVGVLLLTGGPTSSQIPIASEAGQVPTAAAGGIERRSAPFRKDTRPTASDLPRLLADPVVKDLFDEIRRCFPDDDTSPSAVFDQRLCYEAIIEESAKSLHPVDVITAVNALVADRPDVFAACHNGGHKAAVEFTKRFWDKNASFEVQLEQFKSIIGFSNDVCQNGFIHGFYDAIGYAKPGMDSFRAAAALCTATDVPGIDCGHGLGHTFWYATGDMVESQKLCGLFEGELRYRCDDGIMMFLPEIWTDDWKNWLGNPTETEWDAEAYFDKAREVCQWWPKEREGDPNPAKGCWIGIVGGVLFRPMAALITAADNDYFSVSEDMRKFAKMAEDVCASLGPAGNQVCMSEWGGHVLFLAANSEPAIIDFCSALQNEANRTYCTEKTLSDLEYGKRITTESSRNQVYSGDPP